MAGIRVGAILPVMPISAKAIGIYPMAATALGLSQAVIMTVVATPEAPIKPPSLL